MSDRSIEARSVISSELATKKYFIVFLTFFVLPLSGISIDIYVPSLPAVSQYFGVDKALAQLSITVYMVALGTMQLFAGAISDSFGRRKPFLISMSIYIVVTLLITFVHTIQQLLLFRLIQGFMLAVTVVPLRAVTADLFEGIEYYKMMNYMTMAWSIGPIIAPAIGGYLQHYFGWQANFYFLAIYSLIASSFIALYLPETSQHKHPFRMGSILKRYKRMLLTKHYLIGISINSTLYSLIILFSIVGPFLIQNKLHYSAVEFGHIALLTGFAWFMGTMINRFLIHMPVQRKAFMCCWSMFIISLITLILNFALAMNIYLIVIPIVAILSIGGILFPGNSARAILLFPTTTGSANALFGGMVCLITGLSSGFGTYLKSNTQIPLASTYVLLIGFCLILYYLGNKNN